MYYFIYEVFSQRKRFACRPERSVCVSSDLVANWKQDFWLFFSFSFHFIYSFTVYSCYECKQEIKPIQHWNQFGGRVGKHREPDLVPHGSRCCWSRVEIGTKSVVFSETKQFLSSWISFRLCNILSSLILKNRCKFLVNCWVMSWAFSFFRVEDVGSS